jgi:chorismate mutase
MSLNERRKKLDEYADLIVKSLALRQDYGIESSSIYSLIEAGLRHENIVLGRYEATSADGREIVIDSGIEKEIIDFYSKDVIYDICSELGNYSNSNSNNLDISILKYIHERIGFGIGVAIDKIVENPNLFEMSDEEIMTAITREKREYEVLAIGTGLARKYGVDEHTITHLFERMIDWTKRVEIAYIRAVSKIQDAAD